MNVLIAGGAGFVGCHLVDSLLSKGHRVDCVDNLHLGRVDLIRHQMSNKMFKFYNFDILEFNKLNNLFKKRKYDLVYHLVANSDVKQSLINTKWDVDLTFMSTYNILETMRLNKVREIVFASSSAVFGETDKIITEDMGPLVPISLYGAAKLASEAYINVFVHSFDMKAWIIRFPNVVGERATHGILFDLMNKLKKNKKTLIVLGDGSQEKPYLYVKELVDGINFVWQHAKHNYNCFNLGPNSTITVSGIVDILLEELGLTGKTQIKYTGGDRGWMGDVPRFRYNLSKAKKLGWRAHLTSEQAIRISVRNLRKEFNL